MAADLIIVDSVTHLKPEHRGLAAVCASHGADYAGVYALHMGVGCVMLNDAGIGRERAGVGGLAKLDAFGISAGCVAHSSARIGDGQDMMARGILSAVNDTARKSGLAVGMTCADAVATLAAAPLSSPPAMPLPLEARRDMPALGRSGVRVIVMDSNGLVMPDDAGHIIVTGSHGGLLGGRPETAVKYPVFAAVYNDAGVGIDAAGLSRLPALDARGIAGACVSAFTSRIGDGASTLNDGWISAVNDAAARHGGFVGQRCVDFVTAMVVARARQLG